jgi:hypothetical protein
MKNDHTCHGRRLLTMAAILCLALPGVAMANTIHNSQWATGRGPDKETAHDNAYAMADNTLRLGCVAINGHLENEQEDNTSYSDFGAAGWMASIVVEADCVTQDDNAAKK